MKVNDYCEFPEALDMRPYTQAYLRRKEKEESGEALDENDVADQAFPPQYYQYKLRGVVIHVGTAESGHYYSLIKDGAEKWFEFNDSIVRPFDIRDLADEAFGGEEKVSGNLGGLSKSAKEKHRNGYLLFYERVSYFDESGKPIKSLLMNENSESQALDVMPPKILQEIRLDNYKFQLTKYMFDREYSEVIQRVLKVNVNAIEPTATPKSSVLDIGKLSILYFMTVILRARDRDRLPQFLKEVKKALTTYYELSQWLLKSFKETEIIKEFLVACQVQDMKYFTTGLIKLALEVVYQRDSKESYEEFKKNSVIIPLINSFIYVLYDCEDQYKMMPKAFEVFSILAGLGMYTKNYLIEQRVISRLIYVITSQKAPNNAFKDYRELVDLRALKSDDGLGDPTKEDQSKKHLESIKSVNEMIDKKKERIMLDNLTVNFNMLVATVGKLGLSIPMPGMSSEDNGFVKINFEESEKSILCSLEAMRALLKEATTKNSRKLVSSLIAHVSYNRENLLNDIFKLLTQEMNARDDQALKVYLITLEKLMNVKDGLEVVRVEKGMQCFCDVLRDNADYYKATDIFIDYLFKMCSRNLAALKLASESKTLVKLLDSWIRDYTNPLQGLSTQKIKLFKNRQGAISTPTITQNSSKLASKMQDRQTKLRKIQKNDPEELGPDYDSDEDYSDHKFELTEKIDYNIDGTNWVSAIVSDTLDEMVSIKTPEKSMWVYIDDDKIGPYQKMQFHYKNEVDFYR